MKALFDTNILIDYLNGIPQARDEIARYHDSAISIVSWMEVMTGARPEVEEATRGFLRGFANLPITPDVAERAVTLRRQHHMRLPDAVIWASAQVHSRLLVTRDTKDFAAGEPGIRCPYVL